MNRIFVIALIFLACRNQPDNNEASPKAEQGHESDGYPRVIDSMRIRKLYDQARWNMYCIYCDDTVKFIDRFKNTDVLTYASLDLKFDSLDSFEDTTTMYFTFYKDSIKCDILSLRDMPILFANGVVFKGDSVVGYTTPRTIRFFSHTGALSRFERPLQPEVIQYINQNKEKLHPWFREEANKRLAE